MHHISPTDVTAIRRLLPGTLVYIKWPDGAIQEAVRGQDLFPSATAGFIFLQELPDNTTLEDVPVIVVGEDSKWHLQS